MRAPWRLRMLFVGAMLAATPTPVSANWFWPYRRAYYAPTNYVETYPGYAVLPTAYYTGATYDPFVYTTAVVVPYRTSYRTAYAVPTSAACCDPCGGTVVASGPVVRAGAAATQAPPSKSGGAAPVAPAAPPTTLESKGTEPAEPSLSDVGAGAGAAPTDIRTTVQSPPSPTSPEPVAGGDAKDGPTMLPLDLGTGAGAAGSNPAPEATPITPANPATTPIPKAPGGDTSSSETPAVPNLAAVNREAMKPSASNPIYRRSTLKGDLNELAGRVVANGTRSPEPNVSVTFLNKKTSALRSATTDALGRYEIRLPDGDWVAQVTTARGRTYPVHELVVRDGQIRDDFGRDVPSLNITR